jgi:catechol 2,3-dioxygenase-like lactoylglutathione lyase family enzyme
VFDHVGLNVTDYGASRAFYERALAPLGYSVVMDLEGYDAVAFGDDGRPSFWVVQRDPVGGSAHVAFSCESREAVDAFHAAALAAGGTDNGPAGVREHYHPTYYGAFVLDPDGNNVEAVCHRA